MTNLKPNSRSDQSIHPRLSKNSAKGRHYSDKGGHKARGNYAREMRELERIIKRSHDDWFGQLA